MENWSANLCGLFKKQKQIPQTPQKQIPQTPMMKSVVLRDPTGREIGLRYELGKELGRGEFGITYLCKDRETGEELACKSISKHKLRTAMNIEDVRREVEIMRHLPEHPNIVSLKYTYEDDDHVHLLMELCQGGDLLDRIVAREHYTESSAASLIKTIVEVIQLCHNHGVMHRNLKLGNLLFADKTATGPLKVADFHLSIFFQPGERLNQIVGNLYCMAPEVLNRNYGPEIDIWSAGVILYFLLCGFLLFWADTEQGVSQAMIDYVLDCERDGPWPYVSVEAKDLVKNMLDPDPKCRLSAQQVLDHPWLINAVKKKPDKAQDLVKKMLAAHDLFETEQGVSQAIIQSVVGFKRLSWPNVSGNAKDLVEKMLDPDPKRRLTAQEVLDHPWLIKVVKKKRDKVKDLVKKMLAAHDLFGYPWLQNPNMTPNVSLEETVRRNLFQFSVMNHLTKTTSRVIAQHLYAEEESVMDTGIKGCVNHDEVRRRLHWLGQQNPDVDVQRLVDAFDGDTDGGYLDYGRFLDISVHLKKRSHEEHIDRAFQFFDKKQSGYIKLDELRKALADKSDTESQKVIKAIMHVATKKDGRISYEEITNRSWKLMKEWSSELETFGND